MGPCPTAVRHDRSQPGIVYCDYQDGDGDHYDNVHCDYQDESDYQDGGADQPDNLSLDDYESEYDYHDGDGDHYGDEICVNKVKQGR